MSIVQHGPPYYVPSLYVFANTDEQMWDLIKGGGMKEVVEISQSGGIEFTEDSDDLEFEDGTEFYCHLHIEER